MKDILINAIMFPLIVVGGMLLLVGFIILSVLPLFILIIVHPHTPPDWLAMSTVVFNLIWLGLLSQSGEIFEVLSSKRN